MELTAGFPARLKSARERAGLTQTDVASALGIAPQSVQKWESGETEPRAKRIDSLAKVLSVSAVELRYGNRKRGGDSLSKLFDEPDPFTSTLVSLAQAENRMRAMRREVRSRRRDAVESSIDVLQELLHEGGHYTEVTDLPGTAAITLPDEFCVFYVARPEILSPPKGPITFDREQFVGVSDTETSDRSAVAAPLLCSGDSPEVRWLFIPCSLLRAQPLKVARPDREVPFRRVRYQYDGDELRIFLVGDPPSYVESEITILLDDPDPNHIFSATEQLITTA